MFATIDPLYLPLKGGDSCALAAAVAGAAGLPSLSGEGQGMGS